MPSSRQRSMSKKAQPIILRDLDATNKLLEAILDAPNGKRMLSRLARTCRAICEPALNILWRDLDSLVPVLWQFPGHLLKKARKPGLGFVKSPLGEEWQSALKYGERVRQVTYNENSNAVSPSVFTALEESRPCSYIFPHLAELTWKAETPAGLARCSNFLNPELRAINLEVGSKFSQLDAFLDDMSKRTQLTSFSFISPTNLPDSFTELLSSQIMLEKVILVAPGALAPGVGRWSASLPELKTLRLDLTGRSMIAVEGFFDELRLRSGDSTPSSVGSTDSGVFSDDEIDFSLIRKSVMQLTGDIGPKGSFAQLRKLHLTGDVSNIALFIKHLASPLMQLELIIEDPPERADWHDLSAMICEKFENSLQSLRVTASSSSRFVELVRSTSRAEPVSSRLPMNFFTHLPSLTRMDFDLPESVIFTDFDLQCLAKACPNLEVLKLCPLARFPNATGAPKLTLETIAHLLGSCKHLHTIALVVDAKGSSPDILTSRQASSKSLLRLHVGHSWIDDSLQVAILLSHLAPHLETLKYFQDKNRPGFIEANARNWQRVSELLPHLQSIRIVERQFTAQAAQVMPTRECIDQSIDATIKTVDCGVHVFTRMHNNSVQATTFLVDQTVQTQPNYISVPINATPLTIEAGVGPLTTFVSRGVTVVPSIESKNSKLTRFNIINKSIQALVTPSTLFGASPLRSYSQLFCFPSIFSLFSLACKLLIFYPLSLPSRVIRISAVQKYWRHEKEPVIPSNETPSGPLSPQPAMVNSDIPLDTLVVEVRN